jgi:hypothetical protein
MGATAMCPNVASWHFLTHCGHPAQVAPERLPDAVVNPELDYFEWLELR